MDGNVNALNKKDNHFPSVSIYKRISALKVSILGIFFGASSFWFGFQFSILNHFPGVEDIFKFVIFGVALALFLLFCILSIILIPKSNAFLIILLSSSILFSAGFLNNSNLLMIILIWLIMFGGLIWAGYEAKSLMNHSLKIKFLTVSNLILRKVILSISIIVAIIFYGAFYSSAFSKDNPVFPKSIFVSTFSKMSKIIKPISGDINFDMSLRSISEKNVIDVANEQGIQLTNELKNLLTKKTLATYQEKINKMLGETINPDEKLSSAIYDVLLNKLNKLKKSTRDIALLVFAALLMFSIQAVSPIIRILIIGAGAVLYELLKIFGFFDIVYEQKSKEIIILP